MQHPTTKIKGIAARAGHWSATHRKTAIFGWLAFVVLAVMIGGQVGQKKVTDADYYVGESKRAEKAITKAPGFKETSSETVLIQSKALTLNDAKFKSAVADVQSRVSKLDEVKNVGSPLNGKAPVSGDGHSALVQFDYRRSETAVEDAPSVLTAVNKAKAAHAGVYIGVFGDGTFDEEVGGAFQDDLKKAEKLSLPITLMILVIAFGALVAAGIPVLLAISAVIASIGLVALPSHLLPVDDGIASVMLLIGMAVGVDYSLFYMRREREERATGKSPRSALQAAAATSGRAVLVSGLTVMVAMSGMFLSGDKTFMGFGMGTMLVVAVALLGSLTVLPAMMAWLGDRMYKARIPFIGKRKASGAQSRVFGAIIDRVMKHPVVSVVVAGGLLVALAIPAFGLQTKVTGPEDLPGSFKTLQAYERSQEAFPGEEIPAVVAVQANDVRSPKVQAAIGQLRTKALATGQMLSPIEVTYANDNSLAQVSIPLAGDGFNETSTRALATLRDEVIPATVGEVPGVSANVSGTTAQNEDFNQQLGQRMPLVFAFVLGLAFMLLLATFRSIVISIKAIVLNLLSVGAAYGVLVLVFQDGVGASLIGAHQTNGITSWLPLFLFVVLFGLSMDYHVFILSRVREAYDRGMHSDAAVAHGVRSTAGVVTSAAAVMIGVFSIFATLSMVDFKQMGVGLAVAILIDATIVRAVLLPATMKLLGDWNWYLPKWLEWLPRVRHQGAGDEGKPERRAPKPTGRPATDAPVS